MYYIFLFEQRNQYSHGAIPLQVGVEIAPLQWNVLNNFVLFITVMIILNMK